MHGAHIHSPPPAQFAQSAVYLLRCLRPFRLCQKQNRKGHSKSPNANQTMSAEQACHLFDEELTKIGSVLRRQPIYIQTCLRVSPLDERGWDWETQNTQKAKWSGITPRRFRAERDLLRACIDQRSCGGAVARATNTASWRTQAHLRIARM